MNIDILLGKTTEHLVPLEGTKFLLHREMVQDFLKLRQKAAEAGFDLQIASAFRDYERQLKIWNAKARGERKLLDHEGNVLEYSSLSPKELMFAILRWSALPGCSRHHWGTDIDVFDGSTQKAEEVQLTPSECEGEGPAARLHEWLDSQLDQQAAFGFYRPYKTDRGGVAPEPWHLSYNPFSRRYHSFFTSTFFRRNIEDTDLLLKEVLLENSDEIYQRFFINLDSP